MRSVITSEASHELPYLDRLEQFDDSWVMWRLGRSRGRDEPLGFGLGEVAPLITPLIWIVLNEAAREFGSAASGGVISGLRSLLRKVLRRKPKTATIRPLTKQERNKVCDMVMAELLKANLKEGRAKAITNALYRALAED